MRLKILVALFVVIIPGVAAASTSLDTDSIYVAAPAPLVSEPVPTADSVAVAAKVPRKGFMGVVDKVINYFSDANKPTTSDKKLDFSFIGGPAYSNDISLNLGLVGAALYKSSWADSITNLSDASLRAQVSITGFYQLGIVGNHFAPKNKYRIPYTLEFESFPTYFWGIGYANGADNANETKFHQYNVSFKAACEFLLGKSFYIGPALHFNYTDGKNAASWDLWEGEPHHIASYGVGLNASFDTRDFVGNPSRGWYVNFQQRFYPKFLFNKMAFSSSELTVRGYFKAWKGAVIAAQVHALLTYGDTPWSMLATFGGSYSMRGYYKGRYRDKDAADVTIELRQHVWRRNSIVAWVGAGAVFPSLSEVHFHEILPNFGIGYRWEFKNRVNVRIDLGFGRHEKGVVFNINEAF